MNAKVIITAGAHDISCCNQIFYNLNARIIGFFVNNNNDLLHFTDKSIMKLDVMTNAYYHSYVKEVIVSPINITYQNVEEFKHLNI